MTSTMLISYQTYFRDLWPILRDMSTRGIPIDAVKREELRELIERESLRVDDEIRKMVPPEVLQRKPKNGYKLPPILSCEDCGWKGRTDHLCVFRASSDDAELMQVSYTVLAELAGLVQREVIIEGDQEKCQCRKKSRESCRVCSGTGIVPAGTVELRWASPLAFNPNSRPQVIRYIKYLGHPVPKHAKRTDANGDASDTTEVRELERLFAKTHHPIYPLLIQKRQLTKMLGTYVDGYQPHKDGKLHSTYGYGTATWQLTSKSPNVQNSPARGKSPFQKSLVEAFNRMMTSSEGCTLVNFDYKSFHAQTTACEAGLPDYLRLAKIDLHSFTTCHFIKHPDRHGLLKLPDNELKQFFKAQKKDDRIWQNGMTFLDIRNGKAKSCGLAVGFGARHKKIYQLYKEDFDSQHEVEVLWNLIVHELFPGLYKWQESIKEKAAEDKRLVSRFGAIRHFFDVRHWDRKQQKWAGGEQAEAAIAFLPASNAFGMIRFGMLEMEKKGLLSKYRLINSTHDSLKFDCPNELVQECIQQIVPIAQAPCPMMIYPGVTGPEGLSVEVESQVGSSNLDLH